jgi:hypothetical protein
MFYIQALFKFLMIPILVMMAYPAPSQSSLNRTDPFLQNLLKQYPDYFARIIQNRDSFKVQIIYTQIDRDAQNNPSFTHYYFNVDSTKYFYPASTIKLPIALLSLQKINELRLPGLNKKSTLITEKDYSRQTAVYNDPTSVDGRPSVANYIKKIFLVSDNDAFNRLYEFLGQEYMNQQLHKMGYADAQVRHRLSLAMNEDENRHTNPVSFYDSGGHILYKQPMQISAQLFADRSDTVGTAYYDNDEKLIQGPMDFSKKNRICLSDLDNILRSIIFPKSAAPNQIFNLSNDDYQFLYQYMSQYPSETNYPSYDSANYWDAFAKLLYWGSEKSTLPKTMRIFNKEGDAYGFLTDISYFADFEKKIEFMLSATIYCNSDGVLNDNKYDYDTVGLPFLKQLGRVIFDYEAKRKRNRQPDLYKFKMTYDK